MDCSVCHQLFTEPKLLPCAHVLCRHCLLNSRPSSNQEALCPLCKCTIADPQQLADNGWDGVVNAFPTDVTMAALVKSKLQLSQDHVCGGCHQMDAVFICLQCEEKMCEACCTVHRRFAVTRDHTVEDLTTVTAERLAVNQPGYCADHKDKLSELFCSSHGAAICHLCASTVHRGCPDVSELTKVAEESREELNKLETQLLKGELRLTEAVAKLEAHLEDSMKLTDQINVDMDAEYDRVEKILQASRRRAKEEARNAQSKAEESVLTAKDLLSERRSKLTSHRAVVGRVRGAAANKSVSNVTSDLKTRIGGLEFSHTLPQPVMEVKATEDQGVIARIEKELAELFKISLTPADVST